MKVLPFFILHVKGKVFDSESYLNSSWDHEGNQPQVEVNRLEKPSRMIEIRSKIDGTW